MKLFGVIIPKSPIQQQQQQLLLPVEFCDVLRSVGGDAAAPKLFFSGKLHASDVNKGLARLAIPRSRIMMPFLTPEEDDFLRRQKDGDGGGKRRRLNRLSVTVIDPSRKLRSLRLSRWNYKKQKESSSRSSSSWSYALNGGWMDVVNHNGLLQNTHIQLWSFRLNNGSLGFIICYEKPAADHHHDHGGSCMLLQWGNKKPRT